MLEAVQTIGCGKKPEHHDTEIGRSCYKALCSQAPPKKEKPALECLRTKEVCCDTRAKAFGWAVTGGLHQNDSLITFPAVGVAPLGKRNA